MRWALRASAWDPPSLKSPAWNGSNESQRPAASTLAWESWTQWNTLKPFSKRYTRRKLTGLAMLQVFHPLRTGEHKRALCRTSESFQRERIGLAAKVLVQGVSEDLIVGCDARKQRHRRPKFQIVGIAKDLADRAALHEVHKPCTLPQSRPKHCVIQVRRGFLSRNDSECSRHGAVPQALELREDEPHPVALFLSGAQFGTDLLVHEILRVHEALEIERNIHDCHSTGRFSSPHTPCDVTAPLRH